MSFDGEYKFKVTILIRPSLRGRVLGEKEWKYVGVDEVPTRPSEG